MICKEAGIRHMSAHTFSLCWLMLVLSYRLQKMVGTRIRILEKCLCLRDPSHGLAHEVSQKISAESAGLHSGEFSAVEAKDVKISGCQKLGRHRRDEQETETIDVAITRLSIGL